MRKISGNFRRGNPKRIKKILVGSEKFRDSGRIE